MYAERKVWYSRQVACPQCRSHPATIAGVCMVCMVCVVCVCGVFAFVWICVCVCARVWLLYVGMGMLWLYVCAEIGKTNGLTTVFEWCVRLVVLIQAYWSYRVLCGHSKEHAVIDLYPYNDHCIRVCIWVSCVCACHTWVPVFVCTLWHLSKTYPGMICKEYGSQKYWQIALETANAPK